MQMDDSSDYLTATRSSDGWHIRWQTPRPRELVDDSPRHWHLTCSLARCRPEALVGRAARGRSAKNRDTGLRVRPLNRHAIDECDRCHRRHRDDDTLQAV